VGKNNQQFLHSAEKTKTHEKKEKKEEKNAFSRNDVWHVGKTAHRKREESAITRTSGKKRFFFLQKRGGRRGGGRDVLGEGEKLRLIWLKRGKVFFLGKGPQKKQKGPQSQAGKKKKRDLLEKNFLAD